MVWIAWPRRTGSTSFALFLPPWKALLVGMRVFKFQNGTGKVPKWNGAINDAGLMRPATGLPQPGVGA